MLTSERVEIPQQSVYAMYEHMYGLGWTDGLPVIPPTDELVQAFIDYTGRDGGEVVAAIPPDYGAATIEKVAINALMAGCRPEYMPVLLAAIEAVMEPKFNIGGVQTTTSPIAPMMIISGPIRNQLDLNCRTNALGPGWRANAAIGRALSFVLRNIGGAIPGTVCKSTLGQPGRYTMCLGEAEEESPWEPLHVERGLRSEQSAVTMFGAEAMVEVNLGRANADRMVHILSHSIGILGETGMIQSQGGEALIILCPTAATVLAAAGLSKQDLKRIIWQGARIPIGLFPADAQEIKRAAGAVVDGMGLLVLRPEDVTIIVAGGDESTHSVYIPNCGSVCYSVTRSIGP